MSKSYPRVAVGLVHHPVYDRLRTVVATNVTNFDIHDIARACKVYGVEKYFIIHPMQEQLMFVSRILDHWRIGVGSEFNPKRREALGMVETAESVEKAILSWGQTEPLIISTSARSQNIVPTLKFGELKHQIHEEGRPCFLLFGTGFGLTEQVIGQCNGALESIKGRPPQDFRHLSVRSAVSIVLDRLLSVDF